MMDVNRSSNSSIAETAFTNVGYQFIYIVQFMNVFVYFSYIYLCLIPSPDVIFELFVPGRMRRSYQI